MKRLSLAFALCACGARTGLDAPPDASAPVDAPVVVDAPSTCRLGVTPPVRDRRETESSALCRFDGRGPRPDALSLVALEGDTLYGVDGRGRSHALHRLGQGLGYAMASPTHSVVTARGEFFAAAVAWVELPVTAASRVTVELALVRRDATLLSTSRYTLPYDASGNDLRIAGNACGVFAFGWTFGARRQMAWLTALGAAVGPIEGRIPYADPDDTATLATQVRASPTGAERVEWFDLDARSFAPARYESEPLRTGIRTLGADLVYATPWVDGSITVERPRGVVERFTTDVLRGVSATSIAASSTNGWMLMTGRGADHVAVNVRTGERNVYTLRIPEGLRRITTPAFRPGTNDLTGVAIASDGELLLGLRDASVGRLYRSIDGAHWIPGDPPLGEVWALDVAERDGTVIGWTTGLGFIPSDWAPAPAGMARLERRNVFVTRGTSQRLAQAALDWRGARHHLSADGGCVSYWSASGLMTVLAATARPREHALSPVAVTPVLRQSRAMSWAFGDDFAVPNVSD
ncbi:MAG: hypothetical protein U0326_21030 [Polyangiales bacterium]